MSASGSNVPDIHTCISLPMIFEDREKNFKFFKYKFGVRHFVSLSNFDHVTSRRNCPCDLARKISEEADVLAIAVVETTQNRRRRRN